MAAGLPGGYFCCFLISLPLQKPTIRQKYSRKKSMCQSGQGDPVINGAEKNSPSGQGGEQG